MLQTEQKMFANKICSTMNKYIPMKTKKFREQKKLQKEEKMFAMIDEIKIA